MRSTMPRSAVPRSAAARPIILAVLLTLIASACGPAAGPPPPGTPNAATPSPAHEQIILWYAMSAAPEAALLALVDDFNVRNPWDITVAAERLSSLDDLRARVLSGQARAALPDVVVADSYVAADFMLAGASVPLDRYISQGEYGLGQGALEDLLFETRQPRFENQIISWPLGREVVVLVYNAKWLGDLGLEAPPDHWSELGEIACAASRDADGDGAYDHFGYAYVGDVTTLMGWLYSREARVGSPDGSVAQFGDAAGLETFRFLRDVFDRGCAYQADGPDGARADFVAGRALFVFAHSSELPAYTQAADLDQHLTAGIAPFPVMGTLSPTVPLAGADLVLMRTTPDRQLAAWLLMSFLTEPAQSAHWALTTGQFPVSRTAAESESVQAYYGSQPLLAGAWALAPTATREEGAPGWPAVRVILSQALDRVVNGGRDETVDAIVQQAVQRADDVLANP